MAENADRQQCQHAGAEAAFSSFKKGDTMKLAPARVARAGSARAGSSAKRKCVIGTEPGCSYDWLPGLLGAAAVAGTVMGAVCEGIDCQQYAGSGGGYGGASGGASGGGVTSGTSGATSGSRTAGAARGVKRIENWGKNRTGTSPQYKVTCHNGTTHRFWRTDGKWDGPFGWIGKDNLNRDQLAEYKCR